MIHYCLIFCILLVACNERSKEEMPLAVKKVDLKRYVGRWYEIARLPAWFENDCINSTAEYILKDDGTIKVINRCSSISEKDHIHEKIGIAKVCDLKTNAKLKVSFFWLFWGDYWIFELAIDYSYAVVGTPDRKYLWILSRKQVMSDRLYQAIIMRMKTRGFEVDKLVKNDRIKKKYI